MLAADASNSLDMFVALGNCSRADDLARGIEGLAPGMVLPFSTEGSYFLMIRTGTTLSVDTQFPFHLKSLIQVIPFISISAQNYILLSML